MRRGKLITIEGIDGAGKSTLGESLRERLSADGVTISVLREPGGVATSERIRQVVKDPALIVGARCEALLYAAARAQLVEEALEPRLARGETVLLDRFVDSSLAYQGAGRRLGVEAVAQINAFATGGMTPDRTLLLDLPPALARKRAAGRGETADRLEAEPDDFFVRIADTYRQLAAAEPERFVRLDATQPPDRLLEAALSALA